MYVRYRQIEDLVERNAFGISVRKCNNLSMIFGCISVVGLLIVANFQQKNIFIVHMMGGTMCYLGAVIWQTVQVIITVSNISSEKTYIIKNINSLRS